MGLRSSHLEFVTAEDVAHEFDVTPETVRRWAREARIPCIRPSLKILRFRLADVERAVSQVSDEGKLARHGKT